MRLLPYSLQRRFLLGLLFIVLLIGVFFTLLLRHHMKELFFAEAHSKADLMVAHVESIQSYVRDTLRPLTAERIAPDEFIIETMSSSYVSRKILSTLNVQDKNFLYRRVAKNARNPEYEVNAKEEEFFNQFKEDPAATRKEKIVKKDGKEYLVIARPVYFTESCMRCHGDPADAPKVLLDMYGSENGFYRETGELAGLDMISVNMESATGAISNFATVFATFFILGMLLLLLSVQGFFNRLVVYNLHRVGQILRQHSPLAEDQKVLAPLGKQTEIEGMISSIEAVAVYLGDARQQLAEYAKNLEKMVKERTADLENILGARSADVQIFMRLLSDLNSNKDKHTLLSTSLKLIARHFGASKAVYICGLSGMDYVEWPETLVPLAPGMRDDLFAQLRLGEATQKDNIWYIPVQTSGQTRGILGLYWAAAFSAQDTPRGARKKDFPFALSLGKQLGIALDNLDALDAILRQNSLLDSIVEGVNDPLILVEHDLTPILANSSAQKLAAQLLHQQLEQEKDEELADITGMLQLMHLQLGEKKEINPVQYETSLDCGRSFMVNIHPLSTNRRGTLQAVIHLRETTEEKRILSYMRQSEKLAAVGQLAAGLAHEINNPLGVIRCYTELLHSSTDDEQSLSDLKIILRHVEQAQSVVSDMLNFSRQHEPHCSLCNIVELLHEIIGVYKPQAASAGVELMFNDSPSLPEIYVDRGMLEQIIVNLLRNAIDAIKKTNPEQGGLITLAADSDHEHIIISITDNGSGIPPEVLSKIFEPFFTTKEPGKGTGLGLSIAFGMAKDLGGRLDVESPAKPQTKNGTTFHLTIPISAEHCSYVG